MQRILRRDGVITIKTMTEIPETCGQCPLSVSHFGKIFCPAIAGQVSWHVRDKGCPLVTGGEPISEFERTINASDLQEWIMDTFPDWCEGDVRLIFDHIDVMTNHLAEVSKKGDLISRQEAIDALDTGCELLRRVLDDTDVVGVERAKYEWGLGLIESYIADMKALPSAQPEYKPVTADDFAKTMSENTVYSFMAWHGKALELMENEGFVICKKTM